MKYVILLGDGMSDHPLAELGFRTPLQAAHTPNMDFIAGKGEGGYVITIPEGMQEGSDVANMSILGYNPASYYTGRAPLEAASMGVELGEGSVAFRCNMVTLRPNGSSYMMDDYSAGHITSAEAKGLIEALDEELGSGEFKFYPGRSYRNLMVWEGGPIGTMLVPPHDISGRDVAEHLPKGGGAEEIAHLMELSGRILSDHLVNRRRRERGLKEATHIWLWGQGKAPKMPSFEERYGLKGAVIAAVDLVRGLGRCLGLRVVDVPGATGYVDTNYLGKAEHCLEELRGLDFVFLHVEAPDEAGHNGDVEMKVKAIEDFDEKVVGTVLEGLWDFEDFKIMIAIDHSTPIPLRTHSREPVPFAIYTSGMERFSGCTFDEMLVEHGGLNFDRGCDIMSYFIGI